MKNQMTIPDEAVQAAWVAHDNMLGYSKLERHRAALTAALPFLTGAASPRAQALEEALQKEKSLSDRLASALEYIDDYCLSYPDLGTISAVAHPALKAHSDARSLSSQPVADGWLPTHRHKKRGTEYALIGVGKMQAENWQVSKDGFDHSIDMEEVAIYRSVDDGAIWVRPKSEFEDGRFETLPASPGASE